MQVSPWRSQRVYGVPQGVARRCRVQMPQECSQKVQECRYPAGRSQEVQECRYPQGENANVAQFVGLTTCCYRHLR